MAGAVKELNGTSTTALVPVQGSGDTRALTKKDMIGSRLYPHIKTEEQAACVIAKAVNHNLCPTFVAENLIPIQGKMGGTGLYLAAVLGKTSKYRTVTTVNDSTKAVIEVWELVPYAGQNGNPAWVKKGTESFTIDDAKKAGLLTNPTWTKYPQHMLYWRAISGAARKHCADAIAGSFTHLIEELNDTGTFDEDGVPVTAKVSKKALEEAEDAEVVEVIVPKTSASSAKESEGSSKNKEVLLKEARKLCKQTATAEAKVAEHFGNALDQLSAGELEEACKLLREKLP